MRWDANHLSEGRKELGGHDGHGVVSFAPALPVVLGNMVPIFATDLDVNGLAKVGKAFSFGKDLEEASVPPQEAVPHLQVSNGWYVDVYG